MHKVLRALFSFGFTVVIVFSVVIPSVTALADNGVGETTIGDVADPGILPDSGLYFMKSWGRNLQLMFAASDTEKARLMLKYTNEDALAIQKMYQTGKYDVGAKHAEQYTLQLQNTVQIMEQVRTRQGGDVSEELVNQLEQNYLQQQEVLLSVLEKTPKAAQNGVLNAIENSNKHVSTIIMAQQGQTALQQYQEQVNQQINNVGEDTEIMVQQRLQVMHGQAEQPSSGSTSGQVIMNQLTTQTQTQTQTQVQNQTQMQTQTQTQTQQQTQTQTMQNQGSGQSSTVSGNGTQGAENKKQGK